MISSRFSFYALLCISLAKAQFIFLWSDSDYYTTTVTTTYEIYPQDDADAQAIVDKSMSEKVFASILPYRVKIRRMTIIREIGAKSGTEYIDESYVPQDAGSTPFKDLVYGLTKNENIVLGGYLQVFFESQNASFIVISMVLTKDMMQMIKTYDDYHSPKTFKELRKKQDGIFEHMLRVWVRENREANEKGELDKNLVTQDVNSLRCENDSGGWKETRAQIEKILIKKSIKYAKAVITEFEQAVGKPIEDVINGNVQSHGLDGKLADAYASLARYIKNKHQYLADIMRQHCDGTDKWATWILCIAVTTPKEWPKVDEAFQKDHKGDSLSKFILQKMTDDKIMAEMIAAIVDSKFKPTTFTGMPVADSSGSITTPSSATPPQASPTIQTPPPSG